MFLWAFPVSVLHHWFILQGFNLNYLQQTLYLHIRRFVAIQILLVKHDLLQRFEVGLSFIFG